MCGSVVLVVEDDRDNRALIAACLRDAGYRVIQSANLDDALAALAAGGIDAILTDADLDGAWRTAAPWQVAERLRAAAPGVPVVVMTAHRADLFRDHAARGFAGVLPKPFDVDALVGVVRRCLVSTP
jgi:DNA-binding NtrC family response regulator